MIAQGVQSRAAMMITLRAHTRDLDRALDPARDKLARTLGQQDRPSNLTQSPAFRDRRSLITAIIIGFVFIILALVGTLLLGDVIAALLGASIATTVASIFYYSV
jgi:hypothetical protein